MKRPSGLIFGLLLILVLSMSPAGLWSGQKAKGYDLIKKLVSEFTLSSGSSLYSNHHTQGNNSVRFSLADLKSNSPSFGLDISEFKAVATPRPRWGRASLQLACLMTYSQARYWIKYSQFIEDWQYELKWEDQKRRFFSTEAIRFDSNAFYLNWTHAYAGLLYYNFARVNNLSWLQSMIFSCGGSLYWEYLVEWREIISINDNIMTGLGGLAIGESWFQMGRYFLNSPKSFSRLFAWLNPFMKLNAALDRKQPLPPYHFHFNPAAQDVYLFIGYRNSPTSASGSNTGNLAVSLHSRIITDASYGLPGKIDEKFSSPFYSQLDFDFMFHGETREEMGSTARVVPVGRFIQNISEERKGYSLYYGLGTAFLLYIKRPLTEYDAGHLPVNEPEKFQFEIPRDFRDKLAAVHFVGPVVDMAYFSGPWKFRLRAEAYPSFGMINAWAINKYSLDHDVQGMKSTLTYYGYYYGLGPALESQAEISFGPFSVKGFASYLYYRSVQGLDRFQSWVLDDSVVRDSRWHSGLGLHCRIPGTDFSVVGSAEWVRRWGQIHEVEDHNLEKRFYLGIKIGL